MVLKIYGVSWATCTQRVLTTLKEKQVTDYELVTVDFAGGEQKTEEFLKKQPFGVIPVLEDDGFFVYESRAICRYIETKYKGQGTELIPTDLKGLGLFEQGASIETAYFDPQVSTITFEKVFKAMKGLGAADEDKFKQLVEKLTGYLDVYEKILSKQEFIGGNTYTLVDLYHLPYGNYLFHDNVKLDALINDRPHVKAWWNKIVSRPSWKEVVAGKV
jgi:glutathione S-transferase